jgi:hypothetical protein
VGYSSTHPKTSELYGGKWLVSRNGRFYTKGNNTGAYWTGGWAVPRADLDAVTKKKGMGKYFKTFTFA